MTSVHARGQLPMLAPVADFAAPAPAPYSPLDQLGLAMRRDSTSPHPSGSNPKTPPPIPSLDLPMFRSASIYSVESDYSSSSEPGVGDIVDFEFTDGEEDSPSSPSTPRAHRTIKGIPGPSSPSRSEATTPTEGSLRTVKNATSSSSLQQQTLPYAPGTLRSAVSQSAFTLRPVPVRTTRSSSTASDPSNGTNVSRSRSESIPGSMPGPVPLHPEPTTVPDTASVYGEQGSDWGEDEAGFEWLDTDAPEAANGVTSSRRRLPISPRRLSRFRSIRTPHLGASNTSSNAPTSDTHSSVPSVPNSTVLAPPSLPAPGLPDPSLSSQHSHDPALLPQPTVFTATDGRRASEPTRLKKKRTIVIPNRAAPPPPTGVLPHSGGESSGGSCRNTPSPRHHDEHRSAATSRKPMSSPTEDLPPVVVIAATPPSKLASHGPPTMIPLRDNDRNVRLLRRTPSDQSGVSSSKSLAYSVYDLEDASSEGGTTPGQRTGDIAARGRYTKVVLESPGAGKTVRAVETLAMPERRPSAPSKLNSPSTASLSTSGTAEELVDAGKACRDAGDLPKSAYLFLKAAEAGSATGQIYWGLALRHGLGVACDQRRAFAQLQQACDRSLAEGGIDVRAAAGSRIFPPEQVKTMAPDLALGLAEVGNCFLDGSGVKKSPDVALEYLRMAGSLGDMASQEQLGHVLSKGGSGVKKDMKEAAKWYRAALSSGANTPGLAWVWKEKYNY